MEIDDFISQTQKIADHELKEKVWDVWLAKLPYMRESDYVSYEEMLNIVKQKEKPELSSEPISGVYVDQVLF
jgi:hypothetical protein